MNCYDNVGRPLKTSNPFRGYANQDCSTANGTSDIYWTTNIFDTAGRPWKVTTPDNAVVETAYGLATAGSSIGTVVTVTDQAGKVRRSVSNALGQLIRVDEPDASGNLGTVASPIQPTSYAYDTLENLTTVTQGVQTRTFAYDSLSRLLSATNPESGTINYTYDNNGNLTQKVDARSISTAYTYDALNRVTFRNYSDSTPDVTYSYDDSQIPFSKGKLTKVSNSISETRYNSFDILGRVLSSQQITDGQTYNSAYAYNLSGALIEQTYPSGRVVKNVLDNEGDLSMVRSKKTANHGYHIYASSFTFTAAGAVSSMQLGNGRWESTQFNSRLQPTQIALGTVQNGTDKLDLDFSYGTTANNGNVLSQTITVPNVGANTGFTAIQNYSYDSLNRLKDATENVTPNGGTVSQSWKQTFTFDRYGNRNFDEANTTTLPKSCLDGATPVVCAADVPIVNPSVNAANNRLNGYTFDNAGNTTTDAKGQTFVYDAENKQTEVRDSLNNIVGQYTYDGDGKRIKKVVPGTGETTIFVYDASGKLSAEYSTAVEPGATAKISYLTNDHLGSPRINTDANGSVIARHDYHPFGEEIVGTGGRTAGLNYADDDVRKQFTGYERDKETDLDFAQARYFNSGFGRFSSPDDFTHDTVASKPQSWNLYVYVRNNPLIKIDPTGKTGTVSWSTDENGVVHIRLKATFAIYGATGQGVSKADLKTYKKALENGIQEILTKQGALGNGQRFSMTTDISAKVYQSESAAIDSGRDNIVELGYGSIESSGGAAEGVAFNVQGEAFDRMAVSIVEDPANYRGSFNPIQEAESTFAHEFAAHLVEALHNGSDKESVFYGEGDRLRGGRSVYQSDMKRLMYGYDDTSYLPPPPAFGEKYIPQAAPYPSLGSGSSARHANSRNNSSPSDVYRWVIGVKR